MNPEKAQIKLALLAAQGSQWDDWLEGKEKTQHEMAGAILAIRQARERVFAPIQALVAKDAEEGKLDKMEGLEFKAYVFKQLERVALALENMQMNAEREKIIAEGRAAQMRDVVAVTKKLYDAEHTALVELQKQVAAGEAEPDGRPAMSASEDIAQRRAEAQAAKAAKVPPTKGKRQVKRGATNGAHT
jgi:hypothetical protein